MNGRVRYSGALRLVLAGAVVAIGCIKSSDHERTLIRAVKTGDSATVLQMLRDVPALRENHYCYSGWDRVWILPLHLAVWESRVDVVDTLLACGADPNASDSRGSPPLAFIFWESSQGNRTGYCTDDQLLCAKALIAAGANVNFALTGGQRGTSMVHEAAEKCDLDRFNEIVDLGIDVHALDGIGTTAYEYACNPIPVHRDSVPVVRRLLELGVDCNIRNNDGLSGVDFITKRGILDAVSDLIPKQPKSTDDSGASREPGS